MCFLTYNNTLINVTFFAQLRRLKCNDFTHYYTILRHFECSVFIYNYTILNVMFLGIITLFLM